MSMQEKEIRDDEIRIIGAKTSGNHSKPHLWLWVIIAAVVVVLGILALIFINKSEPEARNYFESEEIVEPAPIAIDTTLTEAAYTSVRDTIINDVSLRLYFTHNAKMSLQVGPLDKSDSSIVFTTQAADIRADNLKIAGSFVLAGKPLATGSSKKGYCAIIDNTITIGVSPNTSLFELAADKGGDFFRQYPLVDNGLLVDNAPNGKSFRKALCSQGSNVFMAESITRESFHDFAQSLVDLGVTNAIYLVGSTSYGWYSDINGTRHEFGIEIPDMPKSVSYIIWR